MRVVAASLALAAFTTNAGAALAPAVGMTIMICTPYGMQEITLDAEGRPVPSERQQQQNGPCHFICCERRQRQRG